jgi:hypothetical protein
VGAINALSSLSVTASSTITPATIKTTGNQDYTGAVNLGANTDIITTSNGSVTFNGTVDAPSANSLTINTGTSSSAGAVVFSNAVGATNAVAGLTVTAGNVTSLAITSSSGMTMNSAGTANGITLSGLIKNTGGTGTGIVVEAVGDVLLTGVTNSGSLGIKVTGGKGIAAGTTAGGNIKDLGTVTNTAGNMAISMATPTSGTVSAGQPGSPEYQIGLTTTNAALGTNVTYNQAGGSYVQPTGFVPGSGYGYVNYRKNTTRSISVGLNNDYSQVYGIAYNSATALDWLRSLTNSTVTVTESEPTLFGGTLSTAQALSSLIFSSTIGGSNSNNVQTNTPLSTGTILSNTGNAVTVTGTTHKYTITPANLSAVGTQVYNGTSTFTGSNLTVSGVSGETFTVSSGTATLANSGHVQTSQAASALNSIVLAGVSGSLTSNYNTLTAAQTLLTVTKAPLGISNTTATYAGSTTIASSNGSLVLTGLVGSDAGATATSGVIDNANVGSATKFTSVVLSNGNQGDYALNTNVNTSLGTNTTNTVALNAKAIIITNTANNTTYDGVTSYATLVARTGFTNTALVGADAIGSVTQTATINGRAVNGVAQAGRFIATPSAAVLSTGTAGNYRFSYVPATDSVAKANLSINGIASTSGNIYNGNAYTSAYTTTFLVSDAVSATITGMVSETNAGTYTSSLGVTGAVLANYNTPAINDASFVITPKAIIITNTASNSTFDGVTSYAALAARAGFTNTALVGADAIGSVTQTTTINGHAVSGVAQAGSFIATPSAAVLSTGTAGNYSFSYVPATNTVAKANLSINADLTGLLQVNMQNQMSLSTDTFDTNSSPHKAWKYDPAPFISGVPPQVNKTVVVIPFNDQRNYDDSDMLAMRLIPLMPYGWQELHTPEGVQGYIASGLRLWRPNEDIAKAACEELNSANIFKEAFYSTHASEGDLILQGTIKSTKYNGKIFSYSLSVESPLFWFIGLPASNVSNELVVSFKLEDRKHNKVLWEKEYHDISLRYSLNSDFEYPVMLKKILVDVVDDIKADLPTLKTKFVN